MSKLEPVDVMQCQAERQVGAFALGGHIGERTRCTAPPQWVATEKRLWKDGLQGSMSLCSGCKKALIDLLGKDFATFEKIGEETT